MKNGWEGLRAQFYQRCREAPEKEKYPLEYNPDERAFDAVHLHEAKISGTVELTEGFLSIGEVSLNSAEIDGGLFCRDGTFFQHDGVALSMDGINVRGSIYLDQFKHRTDKTKEIFPFLAFGTISMRGATIGHRLFIIDAYFFRETNGNIIKSAIAQGNDALRERENFSLYAKRLKVAGDVFFQKTPDFFQKTTDVANSDQWLRDKRDKELRETGPICLENAHIERSAASYCPPGHIILR